MLINVISYLPFAVTDHTKLSKLPVNICPSKWIINKILCTHLLTESVFESQMTLTPDIPRSSENFWLIVLGMVTFIPSQHPNHRTENKKVTVAEHMTE